MSYSRAATFNGKSGDPAFEIDAATGTLLKTIPQLGLVAAFAFSPNGASTYVVNASDSAVAQVDVTTGTRVATNGVGSSVTDLAVDPGGTGVWTNTDPFSSNSLVVIDDGTVKSFRPGLGGVSIAFGPSNGLVYILTQIISNLGNSATTAVGIYQASNQMKVGEILVGPNTYASAAQIAVSGDGTRLYVLAYYLYNGSPPNNGYIFSFDTSTKKMIASLHVPTIGPMALSADSTSLFICGMNGEIRVVDTATMTLKTIIFVAGNSGLFTGLALNLNGTHAYVVDPKNKRVEVFNPKTGKAIGFFAVGTTPNQVAFTPDGTQAYVTDTVSNSVAVVDTASNKVTGSIDVGGPSGPITFGPY